MRKVMASRDPSHHSLSETIHSLLGLKSHLTSTWVQSVCDIITNLPPHCPQPQGQPTDLTTTNLETDTSSDAASKIRDELAILTAHMNEFNKRRRQVLNEFLNLKGNIRVLCRIRPIAIGENFGHLRPVVALDSSDVLLRLTDNKNKTYSFDNVFRPGSSQDEVFSEVEPVIKSALDGYNACIFAYGQTGTGKTFTMEGTPEFPGVVPRAIEALFRQAVDSNHVFLFSFSMLEIYMGNLRDLLIPQPTKAMDPLPPWNSKLTQVLKDSLGQDSKTLMLVHISPNEEDLCETVCSLNFATRVRSVHLGKTDSTVEREKEVAMIDLQQKIKLIEAERQEARTSIKKLTEDLDKLTGTSPSFGEQLDAYHLYKYNERPQPNLEISRNKTRNIAAAPLSQVPRFMRPTVCSRRKSGLEHLTSEETVRVPDCHLARN